MFLRDIIPGYYVNIEKPNILKRFLKYTMIPNKFILFSKTETSPVLFKGLTAHYKDKIDVI